MNLDNFTLINMTNIEDLKDATRDFQVDNVRKIFDSGFSFSSQDEAHSALYLAIDNCHHNNEMEIEATKQIIDLYIKNGFDIHHRETSPYNPKHSSCLFEYIATWNQSDLFAEFLMQYGVYQKEIEKAIANAKYNKYDSSVKLLEKLRESFLI